MSLDEAAIKRAAKAEISVYLEKNFVAFLGQDEAAVERAAAAAPLHAEWQNALNIPAAAAEAAWLPDQPAVERELGDVDAPEVDGARVSLTVSRPYVAHASLGPSCALAHMDTDGQLKIWSHGQGMHNLRKNIGAALDIDIENIWAKHLHGPGCYGHNGADDAALDAAILARAHPGQTIRVQWRREEEFGYEPLGPAMLVKAEAVVDARAIPAMDGGCVEPGSCATPRESRSCYAWRDRPYCRRLHGSRRLIRVRSAAVAAPGMRFRFIKLARNGFATI